ncbi:DUF58 domain-containing protein [Leucobacter luti]|nr:DUF58 domain-containing protein [Leucobacter luti]
MSSSRTETSRRDSTWTSTRTVGLTRAAKRRRAWTRSVRRVRAAWVNTSRLITPTGSFVIVAVIVAALLGIGFGLVEAWTVAIAGALLLLVAVPFLAGGRSYEIRIEASRLRVVAGGEVRLEVEVQNPGATPTLPATAELPVGPALRELPIPLIAPGSSTTLPLDVPTPQRGVIEVGPVTLARRDPVGLLRRELTWPDTHLLHVHPITTALPPGAAGLVRDLEGDASKRLTDADLSFHAVRDYAHGDSRRHIHWRSTAKTGTIMVRQYEESQTARSAILFDANLAEYENAEAFELGVSVAASLALQAVREGRERFVGTQWEPGRERSAIDGLEELPSRTPTQLLDAWSRVNSTAEAAPLEYIARGLAQSRRPLSLVALVTGGVPDPTRLRRAAVAFPPDVTVLTVRCAPLADPAAHHSDVGSVLTVGALTDLPQLLLRRATV